MTLRSAFPTILVGCFAGTLAPAQDAVPKLDLAPKQALLQRTLDRMASLTSCAFTIELQSMRLTGGADAALPARVTAGVMPSLSPVAGGWADGLLWATANEGKDQVVWHGRRMIGRRGEDPWQLRQGVVGDGQPMPTSIDPEYFFPALKRGKLELIRADVGFLADRPVEILTAHAAGDAAYDLLWSGLVPDAMMNSYLGTRAAAVAMLAGRAKPESDIDIALWLDPATSRVQQVKVRCYTAPTTAAGLPGAVVAVGPDGKRIPVDRGDGNKDAKDANPEPLTFVDGLPVRKPKDGQMLLAVRYDIVFAQHDTAKAPALDGDARELLGLPPVK